MTPETKENAMFLTIATIASYVMLFGLAVAKGFTIMSALFVAAIWLVELAIGTIVLGVTGAAIGGLIGMCIVKHKLKKAAAAYQTAAPYKEPHDGGVIIDAEPL